VLTEDKLSPDKSEKLFSVMEVDGKIAARGVATASPLLALVMDATGAGRVFVFLAAFVWAYWHVTSL
jgi:hypothetical protein